MADDTDLKMEKEPTNSLLLSESQDSLLGRGLETVALSSCTQLRFHRLCTGLVVRILITRAVLRVGLASGYRSIVRGHI